MYTIALRYDADGLLDDRGYDADWFRDALNAKGIRPYITGRKSRNEIMFGRLKDWRRVATRYDHCPTTSSAIVLFWL